MVVRPIQHVLIGRICRTEGRCLWALYGTDPAPPHAEVSELSTAAEHHIPDSPKAKHSSSHIIREVY